jgi:hypothetical protein
MLAGVLSAPFAGGRVQVHKTEERQLTHDFLVKLPWPIHCALRYELVDGIIFNGQLKIRAVIGPFGQRCNTHETETEDRLIQSLGFFWTNTPPPPKKKFNFQNEEFFRK